MFRKRALGLGQSRHEVSPLALDDVEALSAARDELQERGLIVVDKRAGTSRSDFLPGGWLKRREDGPALEVWKAPHYLLWDAQASRPVVKGAPLLKPAGECSLRSGSAIAQAMCRAMRSCA